MNRAQNFDHYTIKVMLPISSFPSYTYSCIGGEKVRNVKCELPFSIVEYLEKWAVDSNTVFQTEGD